MLKKSDIVEEGVEEGVEQPFSSFSAYLIKTVTPFFKFGNLNVVG